MIMETAAFRCRRDRLRTGAEIYGATILKRGIEDDRQNLPASSVWNPRGPNREPCAEHPSIPGKLRWFFPLATSQGRLFRSIGTLALRDVNSGENRVAPLRGKPWEYLFYLDLWANRDDKAVRNAAGPFERAGGFSAGIGELSGSVSSGNFLDPDAIQ